MFAVSAPSLTHADCSPSSDPQQRELCPDDLLLSKEEMSIYRHIRQASPFRCGREPAGRLRGTVNQAGLAARRLHVLCVEG